MPEAFVGSATPAGRTQPYLRAGHFMMRDIAATPGQVPTPGQVCLSCGWIIPGSWSCSGRGGGDKGGGLSLVYQFLCNQEGVAGWRRSEAGPGALPRWLCRSSLPLGFLSRLRPACPHCSPVWDENTQVTLRGESGIFSDLTWPVFLSASDTSGSWS